MAGATGQGVSAPTTSAIYPQSSGGGDLIPQIGTQAVATANSGSPTGGYVDINPNAGYGINTSPQDLLPGGFTMGNTGVSQQSTATASPQSYVTAGESQMKGPTDWTVTPNQTVAGQFAQLTGQGGGQLNPAIQQAEQAAIRSSAAHGGANDLMSQLGAQEVGNNLALSVAQSDAATNAQAGQFNAAAANNFNLNLNQFVQNAQLSSQNFNQALSTLNAQTNQQLQLMVAGVNTNAANTSISLNASIANTQASLNSTLASMGQQYNYTTAENAQAAGIQNAQAWTNYGMQVRLNYLAGVSSQANALQQEIANISSNPNITSAQSQGAMADAVNQFNTLVSQLGAYSSAMMPTPSTGTSSGTYNTPAYNYSYINAGSWPGPSTGGGSASNGFFLNPSSLNNGTQTGIAPINNPFQASSAGAPHTGATAAGGSAGVQQALGMQGASTSYSGNSAGGLISGASAQISGNNLTDASGNSLGSLSDVANQLGDLITGGASAIAGFQKQHPLLATALGLLVPGAGTVMTVAKIINWIHGKMSNSNAAPAGGGGGSGGGGTAATYGGNSAGQYYQTNPSNNGSVQPLGGGNIFTGDYSGTQSGDAAMGSGLGAGEAGYLDNGSYQTGNISEWDGSMSGGGDYSGGGAYGGGMGSGGGGMHAYGGGGSSAEAQ